MYSFTPHLPLSTSTRLYLPNLIKQLSRIPISPFIVHKLCHHFNLALSRLLLSKFKPISRLTASLQVLDEQPRIFLAPPSIMASKALALFLFQSQTALPYLILGRKTDNNSNLRAHKLTSLLLRTICN